MKYLIGLLLSLSMSTVVLAQQNEAWHEHRAAGIAKAKKEAACYAYAEAAGYAKDIKAVHIARIKKYAKDDAIIYGLGYVRGELAVYSSLNSEHYGSKAASLQAAGIWFYNAMGCTTAVAI